MTEWKPTEINEGQPVKPSGNNLPYPYTSSYIPICRCDLFGQGQIVISFYEGGEFECPLPNRWIRFWTKVFFNSKWNFETDD